MTTLPDTFLTNSVNTEFLESVACFASFLNIDGHFYRGMPMWRGKAYIYSVRYVTFTGFDYDDCWNDPISVNTTEHVEYKFQLEVEAAVPERLLSDVRRFLARSTELNIPNILVRTKKTSGIKVKLRPLEFEPVGHVDGPTEIFGHPVRTAICKLIMAGQITRSQFDKFNHSGPAHCSGCQWFHGEFYNATQLICAMHPYGPEDGTDCPDYRYQGRAEP